MGRGICLKCGKQIYPSRRSALRQIAQLHRDAGKRSIRINRDCNRPLMAYECGDVWHIGHRKGSKSDRKRYEARKVPEDDRG